MPLDEVRLELNRQAIDELEALARAADKLKQIITATADVPPAIGTLPIARHIAGQVGMPVWELRLLLAAVLNFYRTSVKSDLTVADTAEAVSRTLKQKAKTADDKDRLKIWEGVKGRVVEAMSALAPDHRLVAAQKALRVAASRQYELVDMRIFTDARPVFNEAGDAITQTVITHVLSLDYHDGHNHRIIQFTLDAADLAELGKLCERATRKVSVIKSDLAMAPWPTSVFREPVKTDNLDEQE